MNVCRRAYPPVERGADESVELSAHPTPNSPSKPTPPTVTNPHPAFVLCFPSTTVALSPSTPPGVALFPSPFFAPRRPVQPSARNDVEENQMKWETLGQQERACWEFLRNPQTGYFVQRYVCIIRLRVLRFMGEGFRRKFEGMVSSLGRFRVRDNLELTESPRLSGKVDCYI